MTTVKHAEWYALINDDLERYALNNTGRCHSCSCCSKSEADRQRHAFCSIALPTEKPLGV